MPAVMTVFPSARSESTQPIRRASSPLRTTVVAVVVISRLARSMLSRVPIRSRCTSPMAVTTEISGGHQSHSAAISPGP